MTRILDFQSFVNESGMNGMYEDAMTDLKDIVISVGEEQMPVANNKLIIRIDPMGTVSFDKLSDQEMKKGRVKFVSGMEYPDPKEQVVETAIIKLNVPGTHSAEVLATNAMESKDKSYNILGNILNVDSLGTPGLNSERAKDVIKAIFMAKKDPKSANLLRQNKLFNNFINGLVDKSYRESEVISSLGENYAKNLDAAVLRQAVQSSNTEATS